MSPVTCPQTPSLIWLTACAVLQITLKPGASVKRGGICAAQAGERERAEGAPDLD